MGCRAGHDHWRFNGDVRGARGDGRGGGVQWSPDGGKAKGADVVIMTATTFHDQPDILVTDSAFHGMKRRT
jgi:hypothetical protein